MHYSAVQEPTFGFRMFSRASLSPSWFSKSEPSRSLLQIRQPVGGHVLPALPLVLLKVLALVSDTAAPVVVLDGEGQAGRS